MLGMLGLKGRSSGAYVWRGSVRLRDKPLPLKPGIVGLRSADVQQILTDIMTLHYGVCMLRAIH